MCCCFNAAKASIRQVPFHSAAHPSCQVQTRVPQGKTSCPAGSIPRSLLPTIKPLHVREWYALLAAPPPGPGSLEICVDCRVCTSSMYGYADGVLNAAIFNHASRGRVWGTHVCLITSWWFLQKDADISRTAPCLMYRRLIPVGCGEDTSR